MTELVAFAFHQGGDHAELAADVGLLVIAGGFGHRNEIAGLHIAHS